MKTLARLVIALLACNALTALAGPEPMSGGKEMKQVAPAPVVEECNWTGFYIGLNAGGQFGQSENKDLDDWIRLNQTWSYDESGFIGGGQIGYNYQWHRWVFGVEVDGGYMNVDGSAFEPFSQDDTFGKTESDFYATFRGRVGFALNCWLFYVTGGGIGVNVEKQVTDSDVLHDPHTDFDFGYCVGGGLERKLGRHWSVKLEYLYFNLEDDTFREQPTFSETFRFRSTTDGHIVRAGLNYAF